MGSRYITDLGATEGEVLAISGALVDPESFPPVRYRDGFGTVATAATSLKHHFSVSWNTSEAAIPFLQLPKSDFGAFLFRDPCRNLVYHTYNPTPGTDTFEYRAIFDPDGATGAVPATSQGVLPATEVNLAFNYFEYVSGGWKPHGDILYAGCGGPTKKRAVWLDLVSGAQPTLTFTVSTAVAAGNQIRFTIYKWDGGNWNQQGFMLITAGNVSTTWTPGASGTSGYFAFDCINNDITGGPGQQNVSITYESNPLLGSAWAHRAIPGLEDNMEEVADMRVLGASMWLKNIAPDLYKNGNIVVAQLPARSQWSTQYAQSTSPTFYDRLFSVAQEKDFILSNGYYGFLKPSNEDDFDYLGSFIHSAGDVTSFTCYDLETPKDFLALAATTQYRGGECTLKCGIAVEFKTTNEWFERQQPTAQAASWAAAISGVSTMRQHYENRVHFKTIMGTIGKIARLASPILSLFGPYGQAAAAATSGVGLLSDVVTGQGDDVSNREAMEQIKDEIRLAQASAAANQRKRLRF